MDNFIETTQSSLLELGHQATLQPFFQQDPPQISELTFTNLFIWKNHYQPCWKVLNGCLVFWLTNGDQKLTMMPPLGNGDKETAMLQGFSLMRQAGVAPRLGRADRDFISRYVDEGDYQIISQPDQDDYVYLRRELVDLSGNRFHRKKNHLNKFLKTYPHHEYKVITQDILPEIKAFQEKWCQARECVDELLWEQEAIMLALTNFASLNWVGAAIYVNGQVVAYSLGEALNPNTAVIHVEKANSEINGAYVAINQMFCQNSWQGFTYINREQDLGVAGLRAAKQSYHPHHMVSKYLIVPK